METSDIQLLDAALLAFNTNKEKLSSFGNLTFINDEAKLYLIVDSSSVTIGALL